MNVQFLENNPFYVLGALPTDKRATIIAKAEEKAFFLDGSKCDEAQSSLLNPSKRLSAEMDWFCECSEKAITDICQCVSSQKLIKLVGLEGLSKLNALLFNFELTDYEDYFELGYAILDIDEQYDSISAIKLMEAINRCHGQAGFVEVVEEDVERELIRKREQIRKVISEKMQTFSEEDYIQFVTMLAEKCIANEDYDAGYVLTDVIDQYELKMQSEIEASSEDISKHLDRIKRIDNKDGIEANITGLVRRLKKWYVLVRPLQLKSMASGETHTASEKVGYDIRGLGLWLHNEKEMTDLALSLYMSVKDFFADAGPISDTYEEDINTLNRIMNQDRAEEEINPELNAVEEIVNGWKGEGKNIDTNSANKITEDSVKGLIAKVKEVNAKIKNLDTDAETISQLRTVLCIKAREGVLYAHNEKQKTRLALDIANMLFEEFGDIPEAHDKLSIDVDTLKKELAAIEENELFPGLSKKGKVLCLVFLVMLGLVFAMYDDDSDGNNNSSYSSSSSYEDSQSDDQSSEVKFTNDAYTGTAVYADIVSIYPSIGIYTEGSSYYNHYVCECETSSGGTVWVYIDTSYYQKQIDPDISTDIDSATAKEITYNRTRRIHGVAKRADGILSGLSDDIGREKVIEFTSIG